MKHVVVVITSLVLSVFPFCCDLIWQPKAVVLWKNQG
jgi:hypothetical protein